MKAVATPIERTRDLAGLSWVEVKLVDLGRRGRAAASADGLAATVYGVWR